MRLDQARDAALSDGETITVGRAAAGLGVSPYQVGRLAERDGVLRWTSSGFARVVPTTWVMGVAAEIHAAKRQRRQLRIDRLARKAEMLRRAEDGETYASIAVAYGISTGTVGQHVRAMRRREQRRVERAALAAAGREFMRRSGREARASATWYIRRWLEIARAVEGVCALVATFDDLAREPSNA